MLMRGNNGRTPAKRIQKQELDVTSNQWQSSPKQQLFLYNYFDPASTTFGNVFQSAISAGYKESYARTLTRQKHKNMWLHDFLSKRELSPDHISQGIASIATSAIRDSDKLKAYELLGKIQGMFIDRSANISLNIEKIIKDLE